MIITYTNHNLNIVFAHLFFLLSTGFFFFFLNYINDRFLQRHSGLEQHIVRLMDELVSCGQWTGLLEVLSSLFVLCCHTLYSKAK